MISNVAMIVSLLLAAIFAIVTVVLALMNRVTIRNLSEFETSLSRMVADGISEEEILSKILPIARHIALSQNLQLEPAHLCPNLAYKDYVISFIRVYGPKGLSEQQLEYGKSMSGLLE